MSFEEKVMLIKSHPKFCENCTIFSSRDIFFSFLERDFFFRNFFFCSAIIPIADVLKTYFLVSMHWKTRFQSFYKPAFSYGWQFHISEVFKRKRKSLRAFRKTLYYILFYAFYALLRVDGEVF